MQSFSSLLNSDDPINALRGLSQQHDFYMFGLGHQLLERGMNRWEGEYYLLKSAQAGYPVALAYFAYQKLELAELMSRIYSSATATEAAALLYRETPIQFRDTPSCRAALQPAIHDIIVEIQSYSPLAKAIDALQRVVAGDRAALEILEGLASENQPQARIWAFLLGLSKSMSIDQACHLLSPYLDQVWAQRWLGSYFLKQDEEQGLRWLWAAASRGDTEAHRLLVADLKNIEQWEDFHYRVLGELLLQESADAYMLASHHNDIIFSKLHIDYLKKAIENGHDASLQLRHAQSKQLATIIILIALSLICFLTSDLPDLFSIIPPIVGAILFRKGRKLDIEFLMRFDTAEQTALPEVLKIAVEKPALPVESLVIQGDGEAWDREVENWSSVTQPIKKDIFDVWELNSVENRWEEAWKQPLSVPWHEVWASLSREESTLALSGAPNRILKDAFSELSTQNQHRQQKLLEDVGYIPIRLCLPHIKKIHGLTTEDECYSN